MADANTNALASIKPIAMLVFFLLVNIFGNIPLRSSVFQNNQVLCGDSLVVRKYYHMRPHLQEDYSYL